jgi:predicted RNA-binding protein with EMAP domain
MKVSLSWLKEYVALEWDADRLAEALTMAGLEVEAVYDRFDYLQDVKVAQVKTVAAHPNADKLKVCEVSTGSEHVTVVCGAPNVIRWNDRCAGPAGNSSAGWTHPDGNQDSWCGLAGHALQ